MERSGRILIVDDDEVSRRVLFKMFEEQGFTSATAATGVEAQKKMGEAFYHVVLLDINLPDIDGVELLSKLKYRHPDTAAIMVTGHASLDNAVQALNKGASGYIIKPAETNEMILKITEAIEKQELAIENKQLTRALKNELEQRLEAEKTLMDQKNELQQLNSALQVILRKREEDRSELEHNLICNARESIIPNIERLGKTTLDEKQVFYLDMIKTSIDEIVSPLTRQLSTDYIDLTPMEIQVAQLIKQGNQTKEIADKLNLSENTILTHRFKIRSKLGLLNKKTNLRSYLNTFCTQ